MQETLMAAMDQFGYAGVFLLILIENIFPPIPSEVVLLFGGAMTVQTQLSVPGVILAATLGSVAGALALYTLGRVLKTERLKALFASRFGRVLRLKPAYVDQAADWFGRYQNKAVLICRCVPLVRSLISIPAGCNRMNLPLFLLLTTLGSTVWNTVLVLVGRALGDAWEAALPFLDQYTVAIVVILGLAVVGFAAWMFLKRRHPNR